MENTNHSSNQLPPLSNMLKWDTNRYQKFINHPEIKNTYKQEFLDAFFEYLQYVSQYSSQEEQNNILENPLEADFVPEFGIYMTIFSVFLEVYGSNIVSSQTQNRFNQYHNIILQSQTQYIKKTQQEMAQVLDPKYLYNIYESYLQKYGTTFTEQCEFIGQHIWYNKRELWAEWWLSILDITSTFKELDKTEQEQYCSNIQQRYFKPYLIANSSICQKYISSKDTEKSQQEINNDATNIYKTMIDHLSKQEYPIKLRIDETFVFTRPILNNVDFDRLYHELLSFIGNEWNDPEYIYLDTYKTKNSPINAIKFSYTDEGGNLLSPMDYITERIVAWYEEIDDNEDENDNEDDEDDSIEQLIQSTKNIDESNLTNEELNEISDVVWWYIEERSGESEEDEEDSKKYQIKILNQVRRELPKYYQLDLYVWFDQEELLPTFTIKLNQYTNKFDEKNERSSVALSPKPIITKATFCIGYEYTDPNRYISHFVNFMDNLSPDYDCLKMLWVNPDNTTD